MEEAEGTRRVLTRSRKPLSDLTNTSHHSPLPRRNPNKPNLSSSSSSSCSPKSAAAKRASTTIVPIDNVSSNPTSPPPSFFPEPSSPKTSSLHGNSGTVVDLEGSEPISVVYSRRSAPNRRSARNRRKGKGKAVAFAFSSAPTMKISDSRQKSDGVEGSNPPKAKALTVPCRKKRLAVSSEQDMFKDPGGSSEQDIFKDPLLQDYIEKQKAYFKMIDEFTLSEEEVERVDELD